MIAQQEASAQSIFSSSDFATLEDSFMVSSISLLSIPNFDYSATGDSVTWDFSGFVPVSQQLKSFTDPNRSGYAAAYLFSCNLNCNTNCYNNCISGGGNPLVCAGTCNISCGGVCFNNWRDIDLAELSNDSIGLIITSLTNIFNFYSLSSSALSQVAIGARISNIPLVIDFQNPDRIYSFPIEYGKEDSSFSNYTLKLDSIPGFPVSFPFGYTRSQQRHNEVEGWGTLITPYGVFENVLKMKTIITTRDTVIIGNTTQPLNIAPQTIEYKWFSPDFGIPLLKVTASVIGGNMIYQDLEFIDSVRCFNPIAIFGYQPFPATITGTDTSIEVNFFSLSINGDNFTWDFGDPDSPHNSSTGSNTSHVFSSGGIYTVRLTTCNAACSSPICNTFSLPVLIIDLSSPDTSTSIFEIDGIEFSVHPNPFSESIRMNFSCVKSERINIAVYDLAGKPVSMIPENRYVPGKHAVELGLKKLPAGIYFAKVDTETSRHVFKLMKSAGMN